MLIKHKTTNAIREFADVFPNVSNPSADWLLEQGYEFYTPEPVPKTLDNYRQEAANRIDTGFRNAVQNGSVISTSQPGFNMDVRRNDMDNDIDNIRGKQTLILAGVEPEPTYWVGVSSIILVMRTDLEILELEMLTYGASVYQKKHMLEYQLANCTTIEQCEAIVW